MGCAFQQIKLYKVMVFSGLSIKKKREIELVQSLQNTAVLACTSTFHENASAEQFCELMELH